MMQQEAHTLIHSLHASLKTGRTFRSQSSCSVFTKWIKECPAAFIYQPVERFQSVEKVHCVPLCTAKSPKNTTYWEMNESMSSKRTMLVICYCMIWSVYYVSMCLPCCSTVTICCTSSVFYFNLNHFYSHVWFYTSLF